MKLNVTTIRKFLHKSQKPIGFVSGSWKTTQRFIDAEKRNFELLFFAFSIGLSVGLVGSVFRLTLDYINKLSTELYAYNSNGKLINYFILIILSSISVLISYALVKNLAPEASGSGVQEVEGALDQARPLRWKRVLPVKFVSSLFSLGSGLLLGREGPTIQIGANIGKMVTDTFRRPDDEVNPLVSAGAAAGLATAFNAPLSGIVFVVEELHGHFHYKFFSLAGIMIASSTADFVVRALIGVDPVVHMTIFNHPPLQSIWMFFVFGLFLSLVGYLFNAYLIKALNRTRKLSKRNAYIYAGTVGIIVAIVGIFNFNLIGGGYQTIRFVLDHSFTFVFLLILFLSRLILTILGYSTGVSGGIFAPLLAMGVVFGMLFGNMMQSVFPAQILSPGIFAVAGMAGIFASTVRAPLTGLVLAIEMTANFELILPLLVTSITASIFTTMFGNKPIYTTLLKRTLENAAQQHK